jgi:hypothetical protein
MQPVRHRLEVLQPAMIARLMQKLSADVLSAES